MEPLVDVFLLLLSPLARDLELSFLPLLSRLELEGFAAFSARFFCIAYEIRLVEEREPSKFFISCALTSSHSAEGNVRRYFITRAFSPANIILVSVLIGTRPRSY